MAMDTMFPGESKSIEYKVTLPDKSEKYMKTIVAFANTQGGKLIVGVDDKTHEIVGVENEILFQLMDGIANAVSDSCMPQIIPDIEPQTIDGKTVMLEAVKRQLKLTYDHAILSYVMSILGFLVAMILWGVMRSVLRQEAQYIPLGTIMALGLC
ncbi:MAG: helix-turn-helix domain-containing protein [Anaerobutyricum hallii]